MEVRETVAEVPAPDVGFLPYWWMTFVILAVGLFVVGVQLLVTCEPGHITSGFSGGSVTCSYPFQGYGFAFLYASSLVVILGFVELARYRNLRGKPYSWNPYVVGGMLASGSTALLLLALLVTGTS